MDKLVVKVVLISIFDHFPRTQIDIRLCEYHNKSQENELGRSENKTMYIMGS